MAELEVGETNAKADLLLSKPQAERIEKHTDEERNSLVFSVEIRDTADIACTSVPNLIWSGSDTL